MKRYIPISDYWLLIDNSGEPYHIIAEGLKNKSVIKNQIIWNKLKDTYYGN